MRGIGKGKMWAGRGASFAVLLGVALFMLAACAGTDTEAEQTRGTTVKMVQAKNPCNPCAAKNPCNPCKARNPCNPCAVKNPCNPCAAKNPCNPCGGAKVDPKMVSRPAGMKPYSGDRMQLAAEGKRLWQDRSLGTSGLACGTCHLNYGNLNKTFLKSYPHHVAMPQQRAGLKQVDADEMVQFCMIVPMAGKPLGWGSRELAALTAYTQEVQRGFVKAVAANPCLLKKAADNPCNPCGARNPCNPCAAKNPCNPCGAKNPCNPCGAKNPCYKKK